ncbi:PSP1 domain-containing protein [Bacteroides acidifaciens]|uniref:PSP1 domain-containing protein n=1 Tax=Bacteroides acidifaciens TaxID=85831 RepID=UPI0011DD08B9|nr:regulatory iron-sulfur-containing complex subunit RicT [Bacteroides acidifaciens]
MEYKLHNGSGGLCCKGCSRQDKKLNTYDWLADIPGNAEESDMVEVQFKNTRKGYYRNSNKIKLEKGDIVAVEAAPGHDIGVVTLTGRLVPLQMKKANFKADTEIKRVYRKAKPVDMEKFNEAKGKEHATMIRARQIALNLNLNMKIGDVEYQGDGNKAIFYYIADERVDFRQLIKVLAEVFRVRIEMKQIGARQEAGRIGGIGPCGRELCCATWMTSFVSVSTSAARYQDISLNPQKLAGQCAKLKCCLNYEVDCYVEAQKRLPSKEIELETKDGTFYFFKADILSNQISYSTDKSFPANLVTISGKRAFEIISMNRKGVKPDSLVEEERKPEPKKPVDLLEQESVTRFDRSRNNKDSGNNGNRNNKKKKKGNNNNNNRSQQQAGGENRPQQPQRENDNRSQPSENGNRGERENRPRNNNNNNRNRGQNQGRNNENRRPERPQGQERPQNQERSQNQERPRNQDRQQNLDRQQNQDQDRPERPQGQERRPRPERGERPERNPNQEKPQNNNEKPSQK